LKRKLDDEIIENTEKPFDIDNLINLIEDLKFNLSDINPGEDFVINTKKMVITLTTEDNQVNNENQIINLGDCGDKLKQYYNITYNESLYILLKLDNQIEGSNIPKIEYQIFAKNPSGKFFQLDVSICKESRIELIIRINMDVDFSYIQKILSYENNETEGKNETEIINYYDRVYQLTEKFITSNKFNSSYFNNEIIKTKKMNITLTTSFIQNSFSYEEAGKCNLIDGCTKNLKFYGKRNLEKIIEYHRLEESMNSQKNNNKENIQSIVYLGECEKSLRSIYNLSDNETIYMKILDVVQKGMELTKTEFDAYFLSEFNLTKLNISACSKDKIFLIKPKKII